MTTSLAQQILEIRGAETQIAQTIEELGELLVALSHLRRGRLGHAMDLRDEIADVELMVEQMRLIWPREVEATLIGSPVVALSSLAMMLAMRLDEPGFADGHIPRGIADVELALDDLRARVDLEDPTPPSAMDRARKRKRAKALALALAARS